MSTSRTSGTNERAAVLAERASAADHGSASPLSNHGAKEGAENPVPPPETGELMRGGEHIKIVANGKRSWVEIHPLPDESVPEQAALVDWLAFTLVPPLQTGLLSRIDGMEGAGFKWICGELVRYFNIEAKSIEPQKTGGSGYTHRATFPGGHILWGGVHQKGTINVSITGEGCARIANWPEVAAWLEQHQATLKRVDLAYDDFNGEIVNIERFLAWYKAGEFGAGGRQPEGRLIDDLGSGKGSTFNVGNRGNGKYFRGYEKGKQLGEAESPWVRAECEWRDTSRHLPYDMLTRPGQYLAGAYPCLRFLNVEQRKVRTIFRGAKIAFDRAMHHARQQVGKLVNLALDVFGGSHAEVVENLIRREGYPKRIEPFSYHVARAPEALTYPFGQVPGYAN